MKKTVLIVSLLLAAAGCIFGNEQKKVLFVYEERNESIDPWLTLFRSRLNEQNLSFDESDAASAVSRDLSAYDTVLIYGTVMAFTAKEPVRDWLSKEPDLEGKDVQLFVTAHRWFVDKYTRQLVSLIRGRNAQLVDAVSSATKEMNPGDKKSFVDDHLNLQE